MSEISISVGKREYSLGNSHYSSFDMGVMEEWFVHVDEKKTEWFSKLFSLERMDNNSTDFPLNSGFG